MADITRDYDFTSGQPIKSSEVDSELNKLFARINDLPPDALQTAVAEALGLTQPGTVRRGSAPIPGEESRTNAAYGLLATPDRVQNVVVPANGKLRVSYLAAVKGSADGTIAAAIFLGATQLKQQNPADLDVGAVMETSQAVSGIATTTNKYTSLMTLATGLTMAAPNTAEAAFTAFPTTGLLLPAMEILVAPGTYDVSVQFKASAGTISVKDRRLLVEAIGF